MIFVQLLPIIDLLHKLCETKLLQGKIMVAGANLNLKKKVLANIILPKTKHCWGGIHGKMMYGGFMREHQATIISMSKETTSCLNY